MRVTALHTYPIKGCRRVDHDRVPVQPWGLAGDRRWMVVDPAGEAITQREAPGLTAVRPAALPHGALCVRAAGWPDLTVAEPADGHSVEVSVFGQPIVASYAGDAARSWFSTALGRDARLIWLADPTQRPVYRDRPSVGRVSLADRFPLALANAASLGALNDLLAASGSAEWPLPMTRFRPNVVVSGAPPWAEDAWTGGRIRIGSAAFRAPGPIARCVVTTTDQETGERKHEPLRVLGRHRNVDQRLLFATGLVPDGPGQIAVGDVLEAA